MTFRRHALTALALAAVGATGLLPCAATASKADAFEGKIQPVSGQLYRKAGRLELTLSNGLSLDDAFYQKWFFLDAKLGFHFTDWLSVSAHYALGNPMPTNSTTVCPTGEPCHPAFEQQLRQVPGRLRGIVGAEVAWAPIYGKLNTFSEKVAHIDLSLLAGADLLQHDEVLSPTDAAADVTPRRLNTVGWHVGLGARLFLSEAFAVRLDLKDYVYNVTVPPPGGPGSDTQNQIVAELGVSVFFPFANRRQP